MALVLIGGGDRWAANSGREPGLAKGMKPCPITLTTSALPKVQMLLPLEQSLGLNLEELDLSAGPFAGETANLAQAQY